jgi:hypothetical protein
MYGHDFISQPAFDSRISFLQGMEARSDDFGAGRIGARFDLGVEVAGLFGRKAEGAL